MKILTKDPYQYIIDFIDIAIGSEELVNWLTYLEIMPKIYACKNLLKLRAG
jgi:hypothetical protein